MQARLIKCSNVYWVLCSNGIKLPANKAVLQQFLFRFNQAKSFGSEQGGNTDRWDTECPEMSQYPGETAAYVSDALQLIVCDFTPFNKIFTEHYEEYAKNLLTVPEYANRYNKSVEQVKVFCREGRIPGVRKIGRDWVIPADAPYPEDRRVTVGRYAKR